MFISTSNDSMVMWLSNKFHKTSKIISRGGHFITASRLGMTDGTAALQKPIAENRLTQVLRLIQQGANRTKLFLGLVSSRTCDRNGHLANIRPTCTFLQRNGRLCIQLSTS